MLTLSDSAIVFILMTLSTMMFSWSAYKWGYQNGFARGHYLGRRAGINMQKNRVNA